MNAKELKEAISIEQIIKIMEGLGADYKTNAGRDNELMFSTICHGGDSHKLYFYKDSKEFHCYSNCGQMDIINVVQQVLNLDVTEAINYISNHCGLGKYSMKIGFEDIEVEEVNEDLLLLRSLLEHEESDVDMSREFNVLDKNILNIFHKMYHPAFYNDGISFDTLYKYGIRYDILNQRIIIPHLDEKGDLIAVRCRNTLQKFLDEKRKYTPIVLDGELLSARTSLYFYGLYYNQENIRKAKRVILVESEKSVMQLDSILQGNNIGLALSSSSLSTVQVELLRELGVEEVIVALDKEYENYGSEEEKLYATKVRKAVIDKLTPYFSVSVLWDTRNLIGLKESPTDKGAKTFFELYKNRIRIN